MLEVESVSAGYSGLPVINSVSIAVEEGQFVSIVGPNGAGKTTLFKTISGILTPMSGSIRFEGVDLATVPPARRPHLGIAMCPRGGRCFPRHVMENLGWAPSRRGRPTEGKSGANLTWRRCWPIVAPAGRHPSAARGRWWRWGAGRLPPKCDVDEPSMGLAPTSRIHFREVMEIRRQTRLTILLVEQRVAEALESADHGYVLEAGRVVLEGNSESLRANDRVRKAYLGM